MTRPQITRLFVVVPLLFSTSVSAMESTSSAGAGVHAGSFATSAFWAGALALGQMVGRLLDEPETSDFVAPAASSLSSVSAPGAGAGGSALSAARAAAALAVAQLAAAQAQAVKAAEELEAAERAAGVPVTAPLVARGAGAGAGLPSSAMQYRRYVSNQLRGLWPIMTGEQWPEDNRLPQELSVMAASHLVTYFSNPVERSNQYHLSVLLSAVEAILSEQVGVTREEAHENATFVLIVSRIKKMLPLTADMALREM